MTDSSHLPPPGAAPGRPDWPVWPILVGLAFPPAVLAATRLLTGEGAAALLTSASIMIVYLPATLALVAAGAAHFHPRHVLVALGGVAALELLAFVPALDPVRWLGHIGEGLLPGTAPDVLGKSLFVAGAGGVVALSMLGGITLFRLVALVLSGAQCVTLVLFHLAAISWPLEGGRMQEAQMAQATVQVDGDLLRLCALDGRSCYSGAPEAARAWAARTLANPAQAFSLLDDTRQMAPLLYTWTEMPVPGDLGGVVFVTAHKPDPDSITLMASQAGPRLLYAPMRTAAGTLIAFFHQAWITLALLVLWRHRPASWAGPGRGWRRDGAHPRRPGRPSPERQT